MPIRRFSVWMLAAAAAISSPLSAICLNQEKPATDIVGDYEIQLETRTLPFKILLKDGKPYFDALIPGGEAQLMAPVQGKELAFTTIDPNGDETVLTFVKDPKGLITGCKVFVPARNVEADAIKVVKKA